MEPTIELIETGRGPRRPVVLGHGVALDRRSLAPMRELLVAAGHLVLEWELPGHGAAPVAASSWCTAGLGRALAEAVRERDLHEPVVIGVSLAGYASLEAVGGPSALEVSVLVVIGCSGRPSPPPDANRLAHLAEWARADRLDPVVAGAMSAAELGVDHVARSALEQRWHAPGIGARLLPAYLALFTRDDPRVAAAVVRDRGTRCGVVTGSHDPWVAGSDALALAELLGAPAIQIDGASHQPQLTHAMATLRALDAELSGIDALDGEQINAEVMHTKR